MRSLDHLAFGVRLGRGQTPVHSRMGRRWMFESNVVRPSVREFDLAHQAPFDAADGVFHAQFDLDGNVTMSGDALAPSGAEVEFGGFVTACLE